MAAGGHGGRGGAGDPARGAARRRLDALDDAPLAERFGIGKDTVARIWRDHELKPWKVETFKLSNDPHFEEKLVDVVGLYLNPPERAVVFSFDEKTQCQALDRTQPSLPMQPGRAGTMTHDYKRHGTIDLFAALNVATGEVLTDCRKHHTAVDVLAFFKLIDRTVPRSLDIHVVLDNLSAHKAPEVTDWLAHPRRARWHLHFMPTSSLAQPGGAVVQGAHRPAAPPRRVLQRARPHRRHRPSGPTLERRPETFIWHAAAEESSRKSAADGPPSPKSNPRRATSRFALVTVQFSTWRLVPG